MECSQAYGYVGPTCMCKLKIPNNYLYPPADHTPVEDLGKHEYSFTPVTQQQTKPVMTQLSSTLFNSKQVTKNPDSVSYTNHAKLEEAIKDERGRVDALLSCLCAWRTDEATDEQLCSALNKFNNGKVDG